jgi:hypothetical protein
VVYGDVSTLAFLRAGVVDLTARADYTVAQGEVREAQIRSPAGLSGGSVTADGWASWSLEPQKRLLTAVFEKPQTGAFTLMIGMQCACGGLPYVAELGVPSAEGVQRQRGFLGLAASESVLMRVEKEQGVTTINVADFARADREAAEQAGEPLRRAYRYGEASTVALSVRAEAVQPEIRVQETASFSLGDERSVLSDKLEVSIAKAGLFSLRLELPPGYEIEPLTGSGVSHWDDARKAGGGVEVFLSSRLMGSTTLNLVLTRPQRGVDERVSFRALRWSARCATPGASRWPPNAASG